MTVSTNVRAETASTPTAVPGAPSVPVVSSLEPGSFYLVMVKNKSELTARSFADGKILKTYRAISGATPGDKVREGDRRTPEGIYFVEREVPKHRLQKLHGPVGYQLNYPNAVDHIFHRTGSGIWIHGVDNEARLERRFDTRGCVVLGNTYVVELGKLLSMRQTPIVIVDDEKPGVDVIGVQPDTGPIGNRIRAWIAAWSSKDAEAYLKFYHPDFHGRGMNYRQWVRYKTTLAKFYTEISVRIRNLKILSHGKYSVAVFEQAYRSDKKQFFTLKRLYFVGNDENAQILAEENVEDRSGDIGSFDLF